MCNQPLDIFDAEALSLDPISYYCRQPHNPNCNCCFCHSQYRVECLVHGSVPCPASVCPVRLTAQTWCRCCDRCHGHYTPSPYPVSAQAQSSESVRASRRKSASGLYSHVSLEDGYADELRLNDSQQPCPVCDGCPVCCICQDDAPTCTCCREDEVIENDRNEKREKASEMQSRKKAKMNEEGDMERDEEVQVIMRCKHARKVDQQQQTSTVKVPCAKRNKRCQCRIGVQVLNACGSCRNASICGTCKRLKRKTPRKQKPSKEGRPINCMRICHCNEEASREEFSQGTRELRCKAGCVKNKCKVKKTAKAKEDAGSQVEPEQDPRLTESDSYLQCCYNYFSKLESKAGAEKCTRCSETVRRVWQSLKEHFTCETGAQMPGEQSAAAKRPRSVSCCDEGTSPDDSHCFPPAELPPAERSGQAALPEQEEADAFDCTSLCVDLQKLCNLLYANREGKVAGVTPSSLLLAISCRQASKTQETQSQPNRCTACQTDKFTEDVAIQKGVVTAQSDEVASDADNSTLEEVIVNEKQGKATFEYTNASDKNDGCSYCGGTNNFTKGGNISISNRNANKSTSSDNSGARNSTKSDNTSTSGKILLVNDQDDSRSRRASTETDRSLSRTSVTHPVKKNREFFSLTNIDEEKSSCLCDVHKRETASASVNPDNCAYEQGVFSNTSQNSVFSETSVKPKIVPQGSGGSEEASRNRRPSINQGNRSADSSSQSFITAQDTQANHWDTAGVPETNNARRRFSVLSKEHDTLSIHSKSGDSNKTEKSVKIKLQLSDDDVPDTKDVATSMSEIYCDTDDTFVTISIENIIGGADELASESVDSSAIFDEDDRALSTENAKASRHGPEIQDVHILEPQEIYSSETQASEVQDDNFLLNHDVRMKEVISVDSAEDAVRSLESVGELEINIEEEPLDHQPSKAKQKKKESVTLQAVTYIPEFLDMAQAQTSKNFCVHHRVKHKHHHIDGKRKVTFHEERCFYMHSEALDGDTSELYFPKNANSVFSGSACGGCRKLRERGGGVRIQEPRENVFRSGVKGSKSEPDRVNRKLLLRCVKSSVSTVLLQYLENKKRRKQNLFNKC